MWFFLQRWYFLVIIFCLQVLAQNSENTEIVDMEEVEEFNSLLLSDDKYEFDLISLPLSDDDEREILKSLLKLTKQEFLYLRSVVKFWDREDEVREINWFSARRPKLFKSIHFLVKQNKSIAEQIFSRAESLRPSRIYFPVPQDNDLPKEMRAFPVVVMELQKATSAKNIVALIRELAKDHSHQPQLADILLPFLYSDLIESDMMCINFAMITTIYAVSNEASRALFKIGSTESYQRVIDFLKKPDKGILWSKITSACLLRCAGIRDGTKFLDMIIDCGSDREGYELYKWMVDTPRHVDDLRYDLLIEIDDHGNIANFDEGNTKITRKLKKEFAKIPNSKEAINTWFEASRYLLTYDSFLGKWDIKYE